MVVVTRNTIIAMPLASIQVRRGRPVVGIQTIDREPVRRPANEGRVTITTGLGRGQLETIGIKMITGKIKRLLPVLLSYSYFFLKRSKTDRTRRVENGQWCYGVVS